MQERQTKDAVSHSSLSRRALLSITGAAAGALVAAPCDAAGKPRKKQRVLQEGDRVKLDADCEELVEKAYRLGYDYEKEHGGCARCTVAALQDALPFVAVDEGLFRGSTCLDGGATPVNVQNCGAFTGAGMVIGYVCGSRRDETFTGSAKLAHQLLHKVYYQFEKHYGTVLCRDVRKAAEGDCPEVVGRTTRWVAETLLAEFAGYQPPEDATPDPPAHESEDAHLPAGGADQLATVFPIGVPPGRRPSGRNPR